MERLERKLQAVRERLNLIFLTYVEYLFFISYRAFAIRVELFRENFLRV